jgi:hypothetical protein
MIIVKGRASSSVKPKRVGQEFIRIFYIKVYAKILLASMLTLLLLIMNCYVRAICTIVIYIFNTLKTSSNNG